MPKGASTPRITSPYNTHNHHNEKKKKFPKEKVFQKQKKGKKNYKSLPNLVNKGGGQNWKLFLLSAYVYTRDFFLKFAFQVLKTHKIIHQIRINNLEKTFTRQ